ncbi:hypothetical protein C8Q75DRAFT_289941 [Abortiporus biennis]|nr:hypothetical protein C8Q75DRAFT_289941 [Abortiporus biennis]
MTMSEYIEVIIYINSSAIVCLRLHAIWSKNLRILLLFALLGLVRPTIRIYLNNQIKNVIQPFIGCGDITNIGSDSIVLMMSKCGPVYANHSIVVYLLRDGTIYFLCLITLYITTLAGAQSRLSGGIPIITEALSSILVSRFILNLRGVYLPNDNQLESFRPSKMSNLHFASQIVGNLGAPLSLSSHSEIGGFGGDFDWETEEGTVEVVQESSNPLSVGLESLPLSVTMP